MNQKRYLGLDIGDRNIGVSISDPNNKYALSLCIIKNKTLKYIISYLNNIVHIKNISCIVCGVPYINNNMQTQRTKKILKIIDILKQNINIKFEYYNEEYSTNMAQDMIYNTTNNIYDANKNNDSVAATIILNNYLNNLKI